MNTNSNVYTIIYTTIIVVVVAAVLAYVSMSLKPMQTANEKAETISQIMVAAQIGSKEEISALGNNAILAKYAEVIEKAYTVNLKGEKVADLSVSVDNIELVDNLKPQDVAIKKAADAKLPVYIFKSGITVIPIYGAGLWGPIWGYIALEGDLKTVAGAYFDHASETPGLGAKIKDEPSFREQFVGKVLDLENSANPFDIVKGGAPAGASSKIDAITGATMTCKGLDAGIDTWVAAYANYLKNVTMEETSNE